MTDFRAVTPFEVVRRLALAGRETPSVYLLILEPATETTVEADLTAETQAQLGTQLRSLVASEVQPKRLEDVFRLDAEAPVLLIMVDRWVPRLIDSIDRNVVLLSRAGTVLLLAKRELAEQLLNAAPNLRNRLTDVLAISPDKVFGGVPV
jgi:hypothetical protein